MHTARTLDGSPEDLFSPNFRKIYFEDEAPIVQVSRSLRFAWTASPPKNSLASGLNSNSQFQKEDLWAFLRANQSNIGEPHGELPQNPDIDSVHTAWRNIIYDQWNHVFYDVAGFLHELACEPFHFHPPAHDLLVLEISSPNQPAVEKVWDADILILPAYLNKGVSIRMSTKAHTVKGQEVENEIGTFDGSNTAEIWYIKAGISVAIHVEQGSSQYVKGLAAVLVYGILSKGDCPNSVPKVDDTEQENGSNAA